MHLPDFLNLGAGFSRYFRIQPAFSEELRRNVFRIRHAVYCEELGYEPVREDGLEYIGDPGIAMPDEAPTRSPDFYTAQMAGGE